jgi:hypothetical protein
MAYCWAALRTLGILIGVFVGLLVLVAIGSGVVNAFLYTVGAGCMALAFVSGVLALFGHQLVRVSKTARPQRIGRLTRGCSGAVALIALASSAIGYGYLAVKDSRQAAAHGPWEQYATTRPVTELEPPPPPGFVPYNGPARATTAPGMFDDLIPKQVGARTSEATPTCDDELVRAHRASRAEAAAIPPPPPGFVLDAPASRVGRTVTTRPCLARVDGERVFRLGSGWEIHAPADTRDQDMLRVFDALPANAVLPVKLP